MRFSLELLGGATLHGAARSFPKFCRRVCTYSFYASQFGSTELNGAFIGLRQKKLFAPGPSKLLKTLCLHQTSVNSIAQDWPNFFAEQPQSRLQERLTTISEQACEAFTQRAMSSTICIS